MKKLLILFVIIVTMSASLHAQRRNTGRVSAPLVPNTSSVEKKSHFEVPLFEVEQIERRTSYGLIKPPDKEGIKVEPLSEAEVKVNNLWDSKIGNISTTDIFASIKDLNTHLICGWRGETYVIWGEKAFMLTDKKIADTNLLSYGSHDINIKETNLYDIHLDSTGEPLKNYKKLDFDRNDSVLELNIFDALLMAFRKLELLSDDGKSVSLPLIFTGAQRSGNSLIANLAQTQYTKNPRPNDQFSNFQQRPLDVLASGTVQIDFAPEVRLSFIASDFEDIAGWMQVVGGLPAKPSAEYRQRYNVQDDPRVPYLISMERRDTLLEILAKNKSELDKAYDANDTSAYDKLKKEQEIKLRVDLCSTFNEILDTMSDQNNSLYYRYRATKLPKLEYSVYKMSLNETDSIKKKKYNILSNRIFFQRMLKEYSKKSSYSNYNEKVEEYLIKMMKPIFKMNLSYSTEIPNALLIPDTTTCIVTGEKIEGTGFQLNYKGKTYAFCCAGCLNKFKADPAKFAK
jgi:YHS domain-containing protein